MVAPAAAAPAAGAAMTKIMPSVIGAMGSLGGAALGGSMNSASSAEAFKRSEQAASTSWDRQIWYEKNKYKIATQGMRRAGLNPILAASGGWSPGQANAPMAQAQQTHPYPVPDISRSAKDMAMSATEGEKKGLVKNQAMTELAKAVNLRKSAGKFGAEEQKLLKDISLITTQINKMEHETQLIKSGKKLTDEQIQKVRLVVQQLQLTINRLQKIDKVYKGAGGQFAAWINSLFGTLNLGATATGSAFLRR